jgi:fructose-1,6-bisphosphatase II
MNQEPDRNLALELVRVTEAGALAAAQWMGRGDKESADQAAVSAMRLSLNQLQMNGTVVIGEGEKDEAPMIYNNENLGTGHPPEVDIAVDPIDGTTLTANGLPGAIAVLSLAERHSMFFPGSLVYMDKIAVGPDAAGVINLDASVEENLHNIARAKKKPISTITVVILNRPRHAQLIDRVRALGARIKMISDGDVAGALMCALPDTGMDVLMGIGGAPEAVITACALKCMGGEIQCRLWARDEAERARGIAEGLDLDKVLVTDDLVSSENIFFAATGITGGEFLEGVQFIGDRAVTHSIVLRSATGTMRRIEAIHQPSKVKRLHQAIDN